MTDTTKSTLSDEEARRRARFMVGNPSAWEDYDDGASEVIRSLLASLEEPDARNSSLRTEVYEAINRAEKAEQQRDQQAALIMDACDLLAERTYGNDARSPAHNARLMLEEGLQRIASPNKSEA